MAAKIDETYYWLGNGSPGSRGDSSCRVRVWWPHPEQPVVLLSDSGQGASLTNSVEYILPGIAAWYGLQVQGPIWVEHYPEHKGDKDGIEFSRVHAQGDRAPLNVSWEYMKPEDVQQLVGEEVND